MKNKDILICSNEDLIEIAKETRTKFVKSFSEAKEIAKEYDFDIFDNQNDILDKIYANLKEKRDSNAKQNAQTILDYAMHELSTRRDYTNISKLIALREAENYTEIVSFVQEIGIQLPRRSASESSPQKSNAIIRVSTPDGQIFCNSSNSQTLVEVVEYAGPENVAALGIRCSGADLVAREPQPRSVHSLSDGWYLITNSNTTVKYEQIQTISSALNLNLKIELLDKNDPSVQENVVSSRSFSSRSSKSTDLKKIRITYPDGNIVCHNNVSETLLDVIKYAGAENVANLYIKTSGSYLVSHDSSARSAKSIGNGWYVSTHSSTDYKFKFIQQINQAFNLGLVVDMV